MRKTTALLGCLIAGLAVAVWLLWERDPPAATPKRPAPPSAGGDLAAPTPLPALDDPGAVRAPGTAVDRIHVEASPARLAMRAAMAAEADRRVVVDVAALRASAPGQAAMRCLMARAEDDLERMKTRSGFQPFEQVDEMAVIDGVAVVRGRFADVKWGAMNPHGDPVEPEPYGTQGQLYLHGNRGVATWGDEILVGDGDREALMAVLDRIEGRAEPDAVPALGGTSGLLPAADLFEVLPADFEVRGALESYLEDHPTGLGFAVQASDAGVQVTLRFNGDRETVTMISTALEAVKEGGLREHERERLGPILRGLQLAPIEGGLEVNLTVPMAQIEALLGECAQAEAP